MLTPGDISNKVFEKKMGGYRVQDVDSFMSEVGLTIAQLNREIADLKKKADAAGKKLNSYESDHDSISEALLSAQKLADSLVKDAQMKADITIRDAEIKASRIKERVKEAILEQQDEFTKTKNDVAEFRKKILDLYKEQIELIMQTPDEGTDDGEAENNPETQAQEPENSDGADALQENIQSPETETKEQTEQEPEPVPVEAVDASKQDSAENAEKEPDKDAEKEAESKQEPSESKPAAPQFKLNLKFDEVRGEYIPEDGLNKKMSKRFGDPDSVDDEFRPAANTHSNWNK